MQLAKNDIKEQANSKEQVKKGFIDKIMEFLIPGKKAEKISDSKIPINDGSDGKKLDGTLKEKIQKLLELKDEQYSDKLLDSELR
jgi:hypothetical protein